MNTQARILVCGIVTECKLLGFFCTGSQIIFFSTKCYDQVNERGPERSTQESQVRFPGKHLIYSHKKKLRRVECGGVNDTGEQAGTIPQHENKVSKVTSRPECVSTSLATTR